VAPIKRDIFKYALFFLFLADEGYLLDLELLLKITFGQTKANLLYNL